MVSFVLCFEVDFVCCLNLMYVFIFVISVRVTEWPPIWEIADHSAYAAMFSMYKYLIVNLVFLPRVLEWEFLSDCAFS